MKRGFTEAIKKQIAASQKWECSLCHALLESTYQVDHTVPLWDGGEDSVGNATAMCVSCHAVKTQNEAIERNDRARLRSENIRREKERKTWREEESRRVYSTQRDGSVNCRDCGMLRSPTRRSCFLTPRATKELDAPTGPPLINIYTFDVLNVNFRIYVAPIRHPFFSHPIN